MIHIIVTVEFGKKNVGKREKLPGCQPTLHFTIITLYANQLHKYLIHYTNNQNNYLLDLKKKD
ncbi:hypothetical protein TTHERM_000947569 (macronuclear) [Tetrahymena thermophila SB210]|uniref:Uncharacterized protein n=1 Tax=Tetrahymena thermophila (strain SB210) TaxID=312017 RepID=W7XGB0_TETTS|nr:hypothetical protein TTHERM_000947569 [Tetrahymena thermophila SB210]EWS71899.1 hypothetical protein TTHERM_000947569 [Tetrahymena thermophila SB210]|eukprot:XP_012655577.1 hypothetical protein TTHERM_000947569 [Tetrahymena thermophila SB210]